MLSRPWKKEKCLDILVQLWILQDWVHTPRLLHPHRVNPLTANKVHDNYQKRRNVVLSCNLATNNKWSSSATQWQTEHLEQPSTMAVLVEENTGHRGWWWPSHQRHQQTILWGLPTATPQPPPLTQGRPYPPMLMWHRTSDPGTHSPPLSCPDCLHCQPWLQARTSYWRITHRSSLLLSALVLTNLN